MSASLPAVGDVLTTTTGNWSNSPTSYSYQWQHSTDGTNWSSVGTNANRYVIAQADTDCTIRVVVTATNTTGSTSQASSATSLVSSTAMPVGNITGWNQVFTDDFTGTSLDTNKWHTYSGLPGGNPGGWWAPSHVTVANSVLTIAGYQDANQAGKWTTGGLSTGTTPGFSQLYGKYLIRFRIDAGVGVSHAFILWPTDNSWPPEIDFSEDGGGTRQTDNGTLHYGVSNSTISRSHSLDMTQWHTIGVEWTAGKLVYTADGASWATVTDANVSSIPMVIAMQTEADGWGTPPDNTTPANVNMYVDWVVAYAAA